MKIPKSVQHCKIPVDSIDSYGQGIGMEPVPGLNDLKNQNCEQGFIIHQKDK